MTTKEDIGGLKIGKGSLVSMRFGNEKFGASCKISSIEICGFKISFNFLSITKLSSKSKSESIALLSISSGFAKTKIATKI